jgi:hypothetical protein
MGTGPGGGGGRGGCDERCKFRYLMELNSDGVSFSNGPVSCISGGWVLRVGTWPVVFRGVSVKA